MKHKLDWTMVSRESTSRRLEMIDGLRDEIYFQRVRRDDAAELVTGMLGLLSAERDRDVRASLVAAIDDLTTSHSNLDVRWYDFAHEMEPLAEEEIEFLVAIMGKTSDTRFIPVVQQYESHENPQVRATVVESLEQLRRPKPDRHPS